MEIRENLTYDGALRLANTINNYWAESGVDAFARPAKTGSVWGVVSELTGRESVR